MLPDAYDLYQSASRTRLRVNILGFRAIRFKFHDQIRQRPIDFQSVTPQSAQGDERFCAL
jgi:hypothetical protein